MLVLALVGVVSAVGCGDLARTPMTSEQAGGTPQTGLLGESSTLVLLPRGLPPQQVLRRLAKPAGEPALYTQTASAWFSPEAPGGLKVFFNPYAGDGQVQVQSAVFEVPARGVNQKVEISMTAFSGVLLNDIQFQFSPSGLVFNTPATLTMALSGDVDKEELYGLTVYHISSDGTVTEAAVQYSMTKGCTLILEIPGFSRYSLGGGD